MNTEIQEGKQEPIASFYNDTYDGKRIFSFLLGLCFLLITFSLLYFGISYALSVVNQFDLAAIYNSIKFYALAALCTFLIFLLFSFRAFPPKALRLDATADHLKLVRGRKSIQIQWSEIDSIRFKITRYLLLRKETRQSYKVWIKSTNRKKIVILQKIVDLNSALTIIRERSFPFIHARIFKTFKEGSPISFGKVTAQQGPGLTLRNRLYPWHEIRSLHVKNGRVLIWNNKGKIIMNCSTNKIPNLDALLSLFQAQGIDLSTI